MDFVAVKLVSGHELFGIFFANIPNRLLGSLTLTQSVFHAIFFSNIPNYCVCVYRRQTGEYLSLTEISKARFLLVHVEVFLSPFFFGSKFICQRSNVN